ncbi:MAG: dihydroorotate dehydrogenase electron transfer subunit [Tepidanaerobacteraceae bacterium]|nr:dihydroorotate dehydrogenase electron transfer subunit [Tepidanaerobacteraceae bacterium]
MSLFCGLVKIKENAEIAPGIYRMMMECPEVAECAVPGQFIHIRCSDTHSPLLRRPISIAMADKSAGLIEIFYRVVGEGTGLLARKEKQDMLDIMGPLGRGFPLQPGLKLPIIVGGGIGMAPLLFLAKSLKENATSSDYCCRESFTGLAFAGFATEMEAFGMSFLEDCGFKVHICTDDGSMGYKGYPTDLLEKYLGGSIFLSSISTGEIAGAAGAPGCPATEAAMLPSAVYACGPEALLKKVKEIVSRAKVPAYLSLEQRMACGVGACLGCAVKSAGSGYLKVCKDGPVFEVNQVILSQETAP